MWRSERGKKNIYNDNAQQKELIYTYIYLIIYEFTAQKY